ncbi:MAG: hypothetical protein ACYCPO_01455 [Acidobacteriaceae bacterium]
MRLSDVVATVSGFSKGSHADKIRFFSWFLHYHLKRDRFVSGDIAKCYEELSMEQPSSISPFLASMEKKKPKEILRDKGGYHLEHSLREKMTAKYGQRSITVQVTKMLMDLPNKVPDVAEREFLDEALICYRNGAFRAAIVMTWNLAFDHLLSFILAHHLAAFNTQWPLSYAKQHAKARVAAITSRDDFGELKESETLMICKSTAIITGDLYKVLDEKLGKRNTAAHPSTVSVSQIQAEGVIDDLVNNVVLKLDI